MTKFIIDWIEEVNRRCLVDANNKKEAIDLFFDDFENCTDMSDGDVEIVQDSWLATKLEE